jgi:hypothetical protein
MATKKELIVEEWVKRERHERSEGHFISRGEGDFGRCFM